MTAEPAVTLRGVPWPAVASGSGCAAVILTGCVVLAADAPPLGYVRLAVIALAGAAAFLLDEPAAAAVDATPRTRRHRAADRAAAGLLPLAVWTTGVGALNLRNADTPAVALLVEGVGVITVALALAAMLRRSGHAEPGEAVATGLGGLLLAALLLELPTPAVPLFPADRDWTASTLLWSLLTAVAATALVLASRDACARLPAHPTSSDEEHVGSATSGLPR